MLKEISYEDQDLVMLDEPKEFDYKGSKVKVYPISTIDAIKLLSYRDKFNALREEEDFGEEFGEEGELFGILSRALHKSKKSIAKQSPTFLMWLANRILEVVDIDFFSKEVEGLLKKITDGTKKVEEVISQDSPKPSDSSPPERVGN